jgi:hypothetical protein
MEKSDAIRRINQLYKIAELNNRNTHFSNINSAKDVWWFDIPLKKASQNADRLIHLLLYDHRSKKLHYLRVPTTYIRGNLSKLVIRDEKKTISLELSADRWKLFQDVRPTSGGIGFGQFLVL